MTRIHRRTVQKTYTLPYVKWVASGNFLSDTGSLNMVLCDKQEGWDGGGRWEVGGRLKREGTCVYLWLIHADVWHRQIQYCKAIILQFKKGKKVFS